MIFVVHGSCCGHVQTTEDIKQRRLPATRGTQQYNKLTFIQVQINAAQRVNLYLTHLIGLGDAIRLEHYWRGRSVQFECPYIQP